MKRSRRELSIDLVRSIHRNIFGCTQITLFPYFTLIPKTGVSFNCLGLFQNCHIQEKGQQFLWLFVDLS